MARRPVQEDKRQGQQDEYQAIDRESADDLLSVFRMVLAKQDSDRGCY